ncbi:MAG: PH domain-containing protein [Acidimicrobiia bacterium]
MVPLFRLPAGLRLAASAVLIVWCSAVVVVLLETRAVSTVSGLCLASGSLAVVLVPVFSISVTPTPDGLVVNNGYRSRCLPRSVVRGFRVDATFWIGRVVVVVAEGQDVPLRATTVSFLGRGRWQELHTMQELLGLALAHA